MVILGGLNRGGRDVACNFAVSLYIGGGDMSHVKSHDLFAEIPLHATNM